MKSIVLLLCSIATFKVFAQEDRTMLSFTTGLSYPIGDFGSKDVYVEENGLANRGTFSEFAFLHQFKNQPLGIISSFSFSDYGYDSEASEAKLDTRTTGDWTVKASNYKIINFSMGLCYNLQLSQNFRISLRGTTGIATTTHPTINESWSSRYNTTSKSNSRSADKTKSISVLLGTEFCIKLFKSINWLIDFSYCHNRPRFDVTKVEIYDGGGSTNIYKQTLNISRLNVCTGIGIEF
jgi:hypothetical protein